MRVLCILRLEPCVCNVPFHSHNWHRVMLVDFESAVLDTYGNRLLEGVYVNFHLARGAPKTSGMDTAERQKDEKADGPAPFYTHVENALARVGGVRGSYLCLLMSPVNDLKLDFHLEMMDEEDQECFVHHHLRLHLRREADALKQKIGKEGHNTESLACMGLENGDDVKHEEDESGNMVDSDLIEEERKLSSLPTMLLCKIDNVVHVNLDTHAGQMFVNPNVPVSDWFRCANQLLIDSNSEERMLPYEKQRCSTDSVYSAVCCTVDEQERWKELADYGSKMGHDPKKVWEVLTNFTIALLRRDPDRRLVEITMFKDRVLRGVLLGGIDVAEMLKVTRRLDINLL
jgi:hypothetical protein